MTCTAEVFRLHNIVTDVEDYMLILSYVYNNITISSLIYSKVASFIESSDNFLIILLCSIHGAFYEVSISIRLINNMFDTNKLMMHYHLKMFFIDMKGNIFITSEFRS